MLILIRDLAGVVIFAQISHYKIIGDALDTYGKCGPFGSMHTRIPVCKEELLTMYAFFLVLFLPHQTVAMANDSSSGFHENWKKTIWSTVTLHYSSTE